MPPRKRAKNGRVAAEEEEARQKLIKEEEEAREAEEEERAKQTKCQEEYITQDAKRLCTVDITTPFRNLQDAVERLLPFHLFGSLAAGEADLEELRSQPNADLIVARSEQRTHAVSASAADIKKKIDNLRTRMDNLQARSRQRSSAQQAQLPEEALAMERVLMKEVSDALQAEVLRPNDQLGKEGDVLPTAIPLGPLPQDLPYHQLQQQIQQLQQQQPQLASAMAAAMPHMFSPPGQIQGGGAGASAASAALPGSNGPGSGQAGVAPPLAAGGGGFPAEGEGDAAALQGMQAFEEMQKMIGLQPGLQQAGYQEDGEELGEEGEVGTGTGEEGEEEGGEEEEEEEEDDFNSMDSEEDDDDDEEMDEEDDD